MRKRIRTVFISDDIASRRGVRLWAFGFTNFSNLFGVSERRVRNWIEKGKFNPSSLESICEFYCLWKIKKDKKKCKKVTPPGVE